MSVAIGNGVTSLVSGFYIFDSKHIYFTRHCGKNGIFQWSSLESTILGSVYL